MACPEQHTALVVDLDGTLVQSDTSWESLWTALGRHPSSLGRIFWAALHGRAALKETLAATAVLDATTLPYDQKVLHALHEARSAGRPLILATGSAQSVAQAVARHLGCFDEVMGSDSSTNLTGAKKAHALTARWGQGGFDYIGNSRQDLEVWPHARNAWLAGQAHIPAWSKAVTFARVIPRPYAGWKAWVRQLRIHHAFKNFLVLVPLFTSHSWSSLESWKSCLIAAVAFWTAAMSGYLVNDLLDLSADRKHPHKRTRPLALGQIAIPHATTAALVLALGSLVAAAKVNWPTAICVAAYLGGTYAYSLLWKRRRGADLAVLVCLYLLRLVGGGLALNLLVTPWLLGFSTLLFGSLAMAKRIAELHRSSQTASVSNRRGYAAGDKACLQRCGLGFGCASMAVLALYPFSSMASLLYQKPLWLWLGWSAGALWMAHLWRRVSAGQMDEDPLVFALKDSRSYLTLALGILAVILAGPR